MKNILFIDNFDSFTYNLVDEFLKRGCNVDVYRNNTPMKSIEEVVGKIKPDLIILSPGPSSPKNAGNCMEMVMTYGKNIPLLGVCLGHQVIIEAFGGTVERAPEPMHGKASYITHNSTGIFQGLPNPLYVGRYHSLCGVKIPSCLEETAQVGQVNMAVKHREFPIVGVQFHPESVLTTEGYKIIENVLSTMGVREYNGV